MSSSKKSFLCKALADGETDTVSHKRIVSIGSLLTLIVLAFMSAFGMTPASEFIYIFAILTGGESVLTVVEKTKKLTSGQVTSVLQNPSE